MLAIATPDHLDAIFHLLQVKRSEERIPGRVSEPKARGVISQHIVQNECFICMSGDSIVASSAIYKAEPWDMGEPAIFARWFYVHPSHRDYGHAGRMLGLMKATAKDAGIPLVLEIGTTPMDLHTLRYFKKRITPCGGIFRFDPRLAA